MLHGFSGSKSLLMIITEKFVQKVQSILCDQVLILTVNKTLPPFTGMSANVKPNRIRRHEYMEYAIRSVIKFTLLITIICNILN